MWSQTILQNYIKANSLEEQIRLPSKDTHNVSICWKAIVLAFPLLGNWLVWKVGNGERVRVVSNPLVGSGEDYKLLENLIASLQGKGIYNLAQETFPKFSSIWHQQWKKSDFLGLDGVEGELWEAYKTKLKVSHVGIKKVEDELIWSKNPTLGIYTPIRLQNYVSCWH